MLLIVPGGTPALCSASEISSARRTDAPAGYVSVSASSADSSRRLYRSVIAVSGGGFLSFSIPGDTPRDFVSGFRL